MSLKQQYFDTVTEAKARMIINNGWSLSYLPLKSGAEYALFNLEKDPDRDNDVSSIYPELTKELKFALVDWMLQDKSRRWKDDHLLPMSNNNHADNPSL